MAADHERGIRLVLVRPSDSRNVGAACRAAKTMGIRHVGLVAGERIDPADARVTAVHAADLVDEAQRYDSVSDAIDGCSLAVAVTRRSGKRRKYRVWTPEQLGRHAAQATLSAGEPAMAVVFGNEKDGLTDAEVAPCHVAVAIPSAPEFPSLNLSHAVQIVAYEIYKQTTWSGHQSSINDEQERSMHPRRGATGSRPSRARRSTTRQKTVPAARLAQIVEPLTAALARANFFSPAGAASVRAFFVDILARADLVDREALRLGRILTNVGGMIRGRADATADSEDPG